jgi:hypothetical protein
VDDLVAHVDGLVGSRQGTLDDFDGAIDPCAETPGIGENDLHGN